MSGKENPIRRIIKRTAEMLPHGRKLSIEQETNEALVSAFVAKAYQDIKSSGFTIQRASPEDREFVSEILNSTVMYRNGEQGYNLNLSAVRSKRGKPLFVSSVGLYLNVTDGIELSKLLSGERRHGFIHKEVYFHTPEPEDTTPPGSRQESGSAYFFKTIKYDMGQQAGPEKVATESPDLSVEESNRFLRELLSCEVDAAATQADYDESLTDLPRDTISVYWERDNPAPLFDFFTE